MRKQRVSVPFQVAVPHPLFLLFRFTIRPDSSRHQLGAATTTELGARAFSVAVPCTSPCLESVRDDAGERVRGATVSKTARMKGKRALLYSSRTRDGSTKHEGRKERGDTKPIGRLVLLL